MDLALSIFKVVGLAYAVFFMLLLLVLARLEYLRLLDRRQDYATRRAALYVPAEWCDRGSDRLS